MDDPLSEWRGGGPIRFDTGVLLKLLLVVLGLVLLLYLPPWGHRLVWVLLLVLGVVAALVAMYVVIVVLRVQYVNRWGLVRSAPGEVTKRWVQESSVRESVYYVTFRIGDREEDLQASEAVYAELEEGLEGLLTYRGERLLRFVPNRYSDGSGDSQGGPTAWRPSSHLDRER